MKTEKIYKYLINFLFFVGYVAMFTISAWLIGLAFVKL